MPVDKNGLQYKIVKVDLPTNHGLCTLCRQLKLVIPLQAIHPVIPGTDLCEKHTKMVKEEQQVIYGKEMEEDDLYRGKHTSVDWCSLCNTKVPTKLSDLRPGTVICQDHYDELDDGTFDRRQSYEGLGRQIGALVDKKQLEYGDSFGRCGAIVRVLYPNGIRPDQYDDALAVVRIIDKLFRIATRAETDQESPYRDIGGYALLGVQHDSKRRRHPNSKV